MTDAGKEAGQGEPVVDRWSDLESLAKSAADMTTLDAANLRQAQWRFLAFATPGTILDLIEAARKSGTPVAYRLLDEHGAVLSHSTAPYAAEFRIVMEKDFGCTVQALGVIDDNSPDAVTYDEVARRWKRTDLPRPLEQWLISERLMTEGADNHSNMDASGHD